MDFFEAQDEARRKTLTLVLLFAAAVITLVVLTNLLVAGVLVWYGDGGNVATARTRLEELPERMWLLISLGVIGAVALASLYKFQTVKSGGRAIAERLGGRRLEANSVDARERRLLNVVEEMAIASGLPVPPVYVLDEDVINAFAAGFTPDDAVIGVTRGTLEHLDRDELQGVIAHEYSHILNGDTRINLRLIAVLHGILFIGLVGHSLLRGRGARRRSGSAPLLAAGLGFLVIGYAGTFFGNLIKAAVSRQRELLADAASVQFTRNPGGIADALKKIGALGSARLTSAAAGEMSHMFFGQAVATFWRGMMATHPPLPERIRAIEPGWRGDFPVLDESGRAEGTAAAGFVAAPGAAVADADTVVASTGNPGAEHVGAARSLIDGLDPALADAAHDPWAARALIHALLLATDADARRMQRMHLERTADAGLHVEVTRLVPLAATLDADQALTLLAMAMPALKQLSIEQYRRFIDNAVALIRLDGRIELEEWVLHRLLLKELTPHFEGPRKVRAAYRSIAYLPDEATQVLSALARFHGGLDAFAAGREALGLEIGYDARPDPDFARLNDALRELRRLRPLAKPRLLKASAATVLHSGLDANALALLRGIAATLDCPMPPLPPGARSRRFVSDTKSTRGIIRHR